MVAKLIDQRTAQLLDETGQVEPPVDVLAIAEHLGLRITYVASRPEFSGSLVRDRLVIEVNQAHHSNRQRFTIGHEIGHYELGHNAVSCRFDERSSRDPNRDNETQANSFSAYLLMPEPWVRSHFGRVRNDELSARFQVSPEAMWRRLESLDLLGLEPPIVRRRREDFE